MDAKKKKIILLAAVGAAVLAVAAVTAWAYFFRVTIKPTLSDGEDISPDSAFLIKTYSGSGAPDVSADIDFDLTQQEDGSYLLTPLHILDAGRTVTIAVKDKSFTFHVETQLLVLSHSPVANGRNVPVNTGIEYRFNSRNIALETLKQAFSMEPSPPEMNIVTNQDGFSIYFSEALEYGTEYTATLTGDLMTEDGAILGEPHVFAFTTISRQDEQSMQMFQLAGNNFSVNSLTSEAPIVQMYIDSAIATEDMQVEVSLRRYDTPEDYRDAMAESLASISERYNFLNRIETEGREVFSSFGIKPVPSQAHLDYNDGRWILQFPEPLPAGWYSADFTLEIDGEPATRQLYLQVSDLSVFSMLLEKDLLLWVNDAATGKPVSGAELAMTGAYTADAVTGEDGSAHIDTAVPPSGEHEFYNLFTIRAGDSAFVDGNMDYFYDTPNDSQAESRKYLSYLFTDRTVYRTTDTIKIWGMIRPRNPDTPLPELKVAVSGAQVETPVTPSPNGTFTAELSLDSTSVTWTSIDLMTGDKVIRSNYVDVADYTKPVYTADTSPEQPVYLLGDAAPDIAVTLDVSMFDGTPASGFKVQLTSWHDQFTPVGGSAELTTDRLGHLRASMMLAESKDSWYPQSYTYQFRSSDAQNESFHMQGEVYVIHRDLMLKGKPDLSDGGVKLDITTNRIDSSAIKETSDLWEPDALKGAAVDTAVEAEIHKIYYEKTKSGTYYDFILRTSVDRFEYTRHDDVVDVRTVETKNGAATLSDLPKSDSESCYYAVLSAADSYGRTTRSTIWLGSELYRYGSSGGTHRYTLSKVDDGQDSGQESNGDYFYYETSTRFTDDEDVTFRLLDNDNPIEDMTGSFLYAVVQDGFSHVAISSGTECTLPFDESLVPNYLITGAYFDGKHIFALENTGMSFNPDKRALEVEIIPDRESYSPSDTMDVDVRVTEKATGQPAANTEVVLSVVDEAVFALREQSLNILSTLYESIYYPYVRKYTSYLQFEFGGPGEKGGGGDGAMRTDFKDTAYFGAATTDGEGIAGFRYRLPDNITSWRLSSVALTGDNHAGGNKTNTVATKDFYILPILNEKLVTGDDCTIAMYGAGRAPKDDDTVAYTVNVQGEGVNKTMEIQSGLREYATVAFGKLPAGDYSATISAKCLAHMDSIRLPFTVVESALEVSLVKTFDLVEGISINPLRYPVSLNLYGSGAKAWNRVLSNVSWNSGGPRLDSKLARKYTAELFRKRGAQWYDREAAEATINELQGGLLRLFSYSENDIELSVKACLAAPNLVSPGNLSGYQVSDGFDWYSGRRSAVYLAQALSGDRITANLGNMLESNSALDFTDKIYAALAMAVSGDTENAKLWYDKLVTPQLVETTTVSGERVFHVAFAQSDDEAIISDTAASMLASVLKTDDAQGLVLYLADKSSKYDPHLLEQMIYLTYFEPAADESKFSYTLDGERITMDLKEGLQSLTLTREQLAQADFKVEEGTVFADAYYAGAPEETPDTSRKLVGVTKRVEPVDGVMETGALVKITLELDFSQLDTGTTNYTQLIIDDSIPSGMRFESDTHDPYREEQYGWYLSSREGQRLQFCVYGIRADTRLDPIVYYARCATPGEYVVESAHVSASESDLWGETGRDVVQIQ